MLYFGGIFKIVFHHGLCGNIGLSLDVSSFVTCIYAELPHGGAARFQHFLLLAPSTAVLSCHAELLPGSTARLQLAKQNIPSHLYLLASDSCCPCQTESRERLKSPVSRPGADYEVLHFSIKSVRGMATLNYVV